MALFTTVLDKELTKNEFKEIGIGLPLRIDIMSIYLGDFKLNRFLNPSKDVIVTSSIKDFITFEEGVSAFNLLFPRVKVKGLEPSANIKGTGVLYYTKSQVSKQLLVHISVKADDYNDKTITVLSKILEIGGKIPFIAGASLPLTLASGALNIANSFINDVIENGSKGIVDIDLEVNSSSPGLLDTTSGFLIKTNKGDDYEFEGYEVKEVHGDLAAIKDGVKYAGAKPYVILRLNGELEPSLSDFAPATLTAAMKKRFYGSSDAAIETVTQSVHLMSDFKAVKEIQRIDKEIIGEKNEEKLTSLNKERAAYLNLITDKDLFNIK